MAVVKKLDVDYKVGRKGDRYENSCDLSCYSAISPCCSRRITHASELISYLRKNLPEFIGGCNVKVTSCLLGKPQASSDDRSEETAVYFV
jgi:hypothetical protein